jgi:hypothetical protein
MSDALSKKLGELADKTLAEVAGQKEKMATMQAQLELMKKLGEPVEGAEAMLKAMGDMIGAAERIMGAVKKGPA